MVGCNSKNIQIPASGEQKGTQFDSFLPIMTRETFPDAESYLFCKKYGIYVGERAKIFLLYFFHWYV